jgi:hypothetical protein
LQQASGLQLSPVAPHAVQTWLAHWPLQHSENAWHDTPPILQLPPELVPVLELVVVVVPELEVVVVVPELELAEVVRVPVLELVPLCPPVPMPLDEPASVPVL